MRPIVQIRAILSPLRTGAAIGTFLAVLAVALLVALSGSAAVAADSDGDGVQDDRDTCPLAYDPGAALADSYGPNGELIRSADWDHDGVGNVCDPTVGMPGDRNDYSVWLRASDGSRIAKCADLQIAYHFSDGSTFTTNQRCTSAAGGAGILLRTGRYITSVEFTVTSVPEGCSEPSPASLTLDATQGGVYLRGSIFFKGDACGAGISKPQAPPTTSTTTPSPTPGVTGAVSVTTRTESFARSGAVARHTAAVAEGMSIVTLTLRWKKAGEVFAVTGLRQAGAALRVSTTTTKTSLVVRVRGVKPGQLFYAVVATRIGGRAAVTTRVTRR